eukprot:566933-Rhodomonas_salina.1
MLQCSAKQKNAKQKSSSRQREALLYCCDGADSDSPDQLDSDDLERHRGRHYPTTRKLAYIVSAAEPWRDESPDSCNASLLEED